MNAPCPRLGNSRNVAPATRLAPARADAIGVPLKVRSRLTPARSLTQESQADLSGNDWTNFPGPNVLTQADRGTIVHASYDERTPSACDERIRLAAATSARTDGALLTALMKVDVRASPTTFT